MHDYDFIAVGIGPFNLGLACLSRPVDGLDGIFLERKSTVDWHPGMLIPGTTMQVPFMADLVTMADPTSPYSFLNYLKNVGRLYPFYIRESFFPLRSEYQSYLRWVAERLDNVRFRREVDSVVWDEGTGHYLVTAATPEGTETYRAPKLIVGTGPRPYIPSALRGEPERCVHSSEYVNRSAELKQSDSITVVGSGQSAAEIYADLLDGAIDGGYEVNWVTRSPRFFPMEYTKLTLEFTSPEYVDYFYDLPGSERDRLNRDQRNLYKGIDADLINAIYDRLYQLKHDHGGAPTRLWTNTELEELATEGDRIRLRLRQVEQDEPFSLTTDKVVMATGYRNEIPGFLEPVRDRLRLDGQGRWNARRDYAVDDAGTIFVQNGELATHGFVTPDLGMGAYRNSHLIRTLTGKEVYPVEERIAFQEFGVGE
ncbi:lysine N(6)-hydroxylase/L-ornithine N(5)-oxygenase family protein [Haloglycomyces albus]|uniref:lysine N(6)-hydroxylase/L-ornithine N(5)-oxygenase family protein n=1 Tax=Haloglycomyces albus TaxID=526067 RepID=UPI00046CE575|nr:lysine N(6)-hydroxylase/L-ornithine N(5)-oxygenase family protein [Haloglycomyces albus]